MAVKTLMNKSKGNEYMVPCIQCVRKTMHKVMLSIDQSGSEAWDSDNTFEWIERYQIVQCQGCQKISFRHETSNSDDIVEGDQGEWDAAVYETLYPSRIEGRRDLGDECRYLSTDVQRIYKETLNAMLNHSSVLTGIGLRALIETVCKSQRSKGKSLYEKIDNLANKKILTPVQAALLHRIRTLGNDAAHEVTPHTDRELAVAMDVVESMLRNVYILPKLMKEVFPEKEK